MKTTKQNGGPAFPVLEYSRKASGDFAPEPTIQSGMCLRDWFAGMAMQGFAANQELVQLVEKGFFPRGLPSISTMSYKWADAMLEERNK